MAFLMGMPMRQHCEGSGWKPWKLCHGRLSWAKHWDREWSWTAHRWPPGPVAGWKILKPHENLIFQSPGKTGKQGGHSSEFGCSWSLSLGDPSGVVSRDFCCLCLSSAHSQAEELGSVVNLCWPALLQKAERHRLLRLWNSQSLRKRHCPDQPLQLSHPQLSHSFVPTLEQQRGNSELDQRHCCYLVTLATKLLLPDFCGKVDFSVSLSFFGSHLREAHQMWDLPFWVDVLFLLSADRWLHLKSVHIMNETSCGVFINEGREFYRIIILYVTRVFPPYMNFLVLK